MLYLLLKDFYSWKTKILLLVFVTFLFSSFSILVGNIILGGNYLFGGMFASISPILCMFVMGIDISKQGSLTYLMTTPVSRQKYVASRYLLIFLVIFLPMILIGLLYLRPFLKGNSLPQFFFSYSINFFIAVCSFAFTMPLVLRYGTMNLLLPCIPFVFGGIAMVAFSKGHFSNLVKNYSTMDSLTNLSINLILTILAIAFILIMGISFYCSVRVMKKKEF